ncbi:1-deoxy-D-xylulose-5-phosphate synthase [Hydrocarboniphaga daqingensis]|jgi:1-deoxy-D-xylulose-5-phosphate synthase|uniref:1-deoxy-D-xylulose-5-phosphate synthase n=1 Tax=Hydrocarboniphaga daqingensis TaxID=490188 RepID=A0A1M5KEA7_9GAMM|nr:1-deoxy-D-xylulose-5-phosphate synthase [Hydrocarboniphaga daqingensis]SHG50809.1 1-deoxy-D-xylulose-5-phosphate synthase [Hydrocarboniphaga daqingensis]
MTDIPGYSLLGGVNTPSDLRNLRSEDLPHLAVELRRFLIETLGRIGGHFAANLGTVELTLALHRCLNTPDDRIVWDVGHQAYPHKIITGRRAGLETIRKLGGLAPFNHRAESEYDAFGVGHSSTSISAAAGMAAAFRVQQRKRRAVAVIGDGGMTGGMAFEALNHAGHAGLDMLVVYNDNDMSISENVGGLRDHSARLVQKLGLVAPHLVRLPQDGEEAVETHLDNPGALFRTFGFTYHGPVDGHDLDALTQILDAIKDARGPQLLHVITTKGKGFEPAEADPIKYHGVTQFDPVTGAFPAKKAAGAPTYTQVFGDWLCEAAERDPRVVAITPAMREGSGLVDYARRFPQRYYDVGIAEQHAVTFAAGLACEGLKPVCAIYSTFLQRGYDQLIHDVAIQNLPVLFAIDRGGLVGADGATHHGAFDLSYLRCIPNLVVMAPSDENECRRMFATGMALNGPSAVRYPRGNGLGLAIEPEYKPLPIGRGRIVRDARGRRRPRVALLAFGCMVQPALSAADILDAVVADMRFVKPIDAELVLELANENDLLVTLEDNARMGGAGSAVNEVLVAQHHKVQVLNLGLPDAFIEHGTREELLTQCGLDVAGILRSVQKRLRARDLDINESARKA